MSIKSTHLVTRNFAIQAIILKLNNLTNEQLANVLEESIHNGFYNFEVGTEVEFEENKQETYPMPYLDDLSNLPEYNDAY